MKTAHPIRRHSFGLGHALFAGVFLLRILALARLSTSPFLLPPRGDMYFYNDWAQRILHGEQSDHLAFYGLPGYPYLLACLYKIFGYNPFIPGFFQALMDAGTALLIYRITLRVLPAKERAGHAPAPIEMGGRFSLREGQMAALLAALGWAFFVPTQAYSAILMPTAWVVFMFWFVVWRLIHRDARPSSNECLILGLLIGITATAVATILFLIPLILAALFLKPRIDNQRRGLLLATALLLFGVVAGTSPCWVHNCLIARDPVILSAHSGINFWIGNNPDSNGYPRFPPGLRAGQAAMLEDSITSAESAAGRPLKRAEVSAYWSNKAKNYIAQHPFQWLRLLLLKLRNFWNAFQYDDLSIITSLREEGIILPGLYFGVIAALALPGIVLAWQISTTFRWIAAAIFLHMIALLTVFITERYRLTIVPGLFVAAAFGLFLFWRSLIAAEYSWVGVYLFLLLASTIFTSWPQRDPSLWALDVYNSGWQALEAGNLSRAETKLSLARAYVPSNPETNFALGNLELARGEKEAASSFYRMTLGFDQTHRGALNNLGVMALEDHVYDAAEAWFRRALVVEPRNGKIHFLLAKALLAKGEREPAQREIDIAVQLDPSRREFTELKQEFRNSLPP